jgi:hypothetical protein
VPKLFELPRCWVGLSGRKLPPTMFARWALHLAHGVLRWLLHQRREQRLHRRWLPELVRLVEWGWLFEFVKWQ